MYLNEKSDYTLKDEILKIHDHFYEQNIDIQKIEASGVDNFIYKENMDNNEYVIKDISGNNISEFSARFAAFNFAPEDKSVMVVINDISEGTRMRLKLSEMMKTIMLCSISHELRSPVNQINGVLTLLLPTLVTNEQKQLVKIANSSTELLRVKIDDMLDFYETETNNFKPEIKPFDPREICVYLKEIFLPIVDHKNVKVYFLIHDMIPDMVYHDMKRITKVMVNLMSNAVKYTKKGVISIKIDWKESDHLDHHGAMSITFSVSDTG